MKKIILTLFLLIFCVSISGAGITDKLKAVIAAKNAPAAAPSAPAWGGELDRWSELSDGSTSTIDLTSGIAQGNTIILFVQWVSAGQTLDSVADDKGNTYSVLTSYQYNDTANHSIVTAYAATALADTDDITITWGSAHYSNRWGMVAYATNCASSGQPDQTAANAAYGTAVSIAASTTATDTLLLGSIGVPDPQTVSSINWTFSGASHIHAGYGTYYMYSQASSSGSKDPGGTISEADAWGGIWISLD